MLGGLGHLADYLALVEAEPGEGFRILNAGRAVQNWCGRDVAGASLGELVPDTSEALRFALKTAEARCSPYEAHAYRLDDGTIQTADILAVPMSCRWGGKLFAIYLRPKEETNNLLEMIYKATDEGLISLAALRDTSGAIADFQVVDINHSAASVLNLTQNEARWRLLSAGSHILNEQAVFQRLQAALDDRAPDRFEIVEGEGAGRRYHTVHVCPMDNLLSVALHDITEVKLRENSFRLLFEGNPVPMWIFDPDRLRFLAVNDAAIAHYGFSRDEFLSMSVTRLWPQHEAWDHLQALSGLPDQYESPVSWHHLRADGSEIEVLTFGRKVAFEGRSAYLVSIWDITERRRAEEKIAHMAHHDALTGLPNRALFQNHLEEALARAKRKNSSLAVLCLDLDAFKSVNDSMGHPAGDRLLQLVAERLRGESSNFDLAARLGGDEFAIIVEGVDAPRAVEQLAARLVETIGRSYDVMGTEVIVGASIGAALSPNDGETQDELMRNADVALYRAKAAGRSNYQFFEREMDRALQARRTMAADLRKAFAAGEFEVFYQPLIDLQNDRLSAFEALIRWHHPDKGMISPGEFIPVLEEMGLIVQVGEWVLQEACREAAGWPKHIRIAVNLSPVQFRSATLVQSIVAALAHSGLDAPRLELEVTESVLLAETSSNIEILHRLRSLGVRVSMDDFGTGYSSLGYLRSFPFDKIKIDRSFVADMSTRPDCLAIVRAVVGLGRSLGVTTTAEGVETEQQLLCLRGEGCNEVQGYLFGRPEPASSLNSIIAKFGKCVSRAA